MLLISSIVYHHLKKSNVEHSRDIFRINVIARVYSFPPIGGFPPIFHGFLTPLRSRSVKFHTPLRSAVARKMWLLHGVELRIMALGYHLYCGNV